jgi:hypothetical protein
MIARDLLYPSEWAFRFFIVALLTRIASPYWSGDFPYEATYCVLVIAGAGALVLQIWLAVKFYASGRGKDVSHPQ